MKKDFIPVDCITITITEVKVPLGVTAKIPAKVKAKLSRSLAGKKLAGVATVTYSVDPQDEERVRLGEGNKIFIGPKAVSDGFIRFVLSDKVRKVFKFGAATDHSFSIKQNGKDSDDSTVFPKGFRRNEPKDSGFYALYLFHNVRKGTKWQHSYSIEVDNGNLYAVDPEIQNDND